MMITREKQRQNAIKTMALAIASVFGLSLLCMSIEIHQHQASLAKQMDYKENLLLERQIAFEDNQREALAKVTQSQHALAQDWERAAQRVAATEKAWHTFMTEQQTDDGALASAVSSTQPSVPDITTKYQPKPLSPQK
jgi:hypothetical protein